MWLPASENRRPGPRSFPRSRAHTTTSTRTTPAKNSCAASASRARRGSTASNNSFATSCESRQSGLTRDRQTGSKGREKHATPFRITGGQLRREHGGARRQESNRASRAVAHPTRQHDLVRTTRRRHPLLSTSGDRSQRSAARERHAHAPHIIHRRPRVPHVGVRRSHRKPVPSKGALLGAATPKRTRRAPAPLL